MKIYNFNNIMLNKEVYQDILDKLIFLEIGFNLIKSII